MKRRPSAGFTIFLLAALLLSACGNEDTPTPSAPTTAMANTTVTSTTSAANANTAVPAASTATVPAATTAAAVPVSPTSTVEARISTGQEGSLSLKYATPVINSRDTGPMNGIALSLDGKRFATASEDKTVKLWDIATQKVLYTFKDFPFSVSALVFSPDGLQLAAAGDGKDVAIWDLTTGKTLKTLNDPSGLENTSLAYSPDGKKLAAGNKDSTVKVWDIASGSHIQFKGTDNQLNVAFSPDGTMVAGAEKSGQMYVWSLNQTDKPLVSLYSEGSSNDLQFSNDNKGLFGGQGLWDIATGKATTTYFNTILAVSSDDKEVGIYDASTKSYDVVDATSKKVLSSFTNASLGTTPRYFAFSDALDTFAATDDSGAITFYDIPNKKKKVRIDNFIDPEAAVAISPDGSLIAHKFEDATSSKIEILNAATGQSLLKIRADDVVRQINFSPDGKVLAASGALWDTASGQKIADFKTDNTHFSGDYFEIFSPDGKIVATSNDKGPVTLWDSQGKFIASIKPTATPVMSLNFSPDSKKLAIATNNGVEVYDVTTPGKSSLLNNYDLFQTLDAAFGPDSNSLLVGGYTPGIIQLPGSNPANFQDFGAPPDGHRVAYSPDGKRIFCQCGSQVFIWDATGQQELWHSDTNDTYNTNDLVVSPDGQLLILSQSDGSIKVMQLPAELNPVVTPGAGSPTPNLTATTTVTPTPTPSPATATATSSLPAVSASLTLRTATAPTSSHSYQISNVGFSPDGKFMASKSTDGSLRIWDLAQQKQVAILKGNLGVGESLKFSTDDTTLATYQNNLQNTPELVQLWDVATGNLKKTLPVPNGEGFEAGFSDDLKFVAVPTREPGQMNFLSADHVVVYDLGSGQKVASFAYLTDISALIFSADDKILYAAGSAEGDISLQKLTLFNVQTGATIKTISLVCSVINQLALSPDQETLAGATFKGPVLMFDASTGEARGSYTQPDKLIPATLAFDNGNKLGVVYTDNTQNYFVYSVSAGAGKKLSQIPTENNSENYTPWPALGANNTRLAYGDSHGNLFIFDTVSGASLASFAGSPATNPVNIVFNPTNQTWVVLSHNGVIQIWDSGLSKVITSLGQSQTLAEADSFMAISPNGNLLASAGSLNSGITLWDLKAGTKIGLLPQSKGGEPLRFSSDSTKLFANILRTLYSWNASDNFKSANRVSALDYEYLSNLYFSPDGSQVGYVEKNGSIGIHDLQTNKVSTIPGSFADFKFLPGTKNLLVSLKSGETRLIDPTGNVLATLAKNDIPMTKVVFSPDGKFAAGPVNGTISLWETATGAEIYTTTSVGPNATTLAITPDGKNLLCGDPSGALTLWAIQLK